MAEYPIKYVTDESGNRCLPNTHTDAVKDSGGTTLTTLLSQKVSIVQTTVSGTSVTQALESNKYYSFGTVANLTITLGTPVNGVNNEYIFEFDSGTTATTLSLPVAVLGIDATEIDANTHYEISIKYDASTQKYYGLIYGWKN